MIWFVLAGCGAEEVSNPTGEAPEAPEPPTTVVILSPQTGDPELGSADAIAFASAGHLVLGDGARDRLLVFATDDWADDPSADDFERVPNLPKKVASALGVDEGDVSIEDIEVNPLSGRVYVAVERRDTDWAGLFTVQPDGTVSPVDLAILDWVAVSYPEVDGLGSVVTDLEWANTHLVAAVTEQTWTSSQVVTVPLPLTHDQAASVTSTHTYHRSHRRWETLAPITTLFSFSDESGDWIGASYQCAPVVRFAVSDLARGDAEIVGVTPFDFGGGRQVSAFAISGDGDDQRVYASVSGLGGTAVQPSLFLETTEVDEIAPVVFSTTGEPTTPKAESAAKLDDRSDIAVLDTERLVVYSISGELEIINNPQ